MPAETSVNTNPPAYISTAEFWLSGPRDFQRGGWLSSDQVGRWINFAITLRDKNDKYTACDGVLAVSVVSRNNAIDDNMPAEKILERIKEKGFFCHMYDVTVNNFHSNEGVLRASFVDTERLVYCESATGSNYHLLYILFQPEDGDWMVWRPSWGGLYDGMPPWNIHWD